MYNIIIGNFIISWCCIFLFKNDCVYVLFINNSNEKIKIFMKIYRKINNLFGCFFNVIIEKFFVIFGNVIVFFFVKIKYGYYEDVIKGWINDNKINNYVIEFFLFLDCINNFFFIFFWYNIISDFMVFIIIINNSNNFYCLDFGLVGNVSIIEDSIND